MNEIKSDISELGEFKKLIAILRGGGVIILPTETVYGIACLPEFEHRLNEIKSRKSQPIARVYKDAESVISDLEEDHPYSEMIIRRLLPGPFTLLLQSGDQKIGVRVPEHELCLRFLSELSEPLVMTSANLHSEPAAVSYAQAKRIFSDLDGLDGGVCEYSQPSALIDIRIRK